MTLTTDMVETAVAKLPRHYQSVFKFLYGEDDASVHSIEAALGLLNQVNASVVASKSVYRTGDYETDSKFQEYLYDVLKKGANEPTILDSSRSILKEEIQQAFKVPEFLDSCIKLKLDTSNKLADLLLGVVQSEGVTKVVVRNMFVQAHITIIYLSLTKSLKLKISNNNLKLLKSIENPIQLYQIKTVLSDIWNRFKYVLLLVGGFAILAYGGTQGLSFNSAPSIFLPYQNIYESVSSPKNQFLFKLQLMFIFGLMFYLIWGNKFHYLVQPDRRSNSETQQKVKKVVSAFYITFLFYLAMPVINYIDHQYLNNHPIQNAVSQKDFEQAEKLVNNNDSWSTTEKNYVLAQLTALQRYKMSAVEYQGKLQSYSEDILKNYEKGRLSSEYAELYAVKNILDANGVNNDIRSYDTHRFVMMVWLLILIYCFISLGSEVDYLGIKKNREKKLLKKTNALREEQSSI